MRKIDPIRYPLSDRIMDWAGEHLLWFVVVVVAAALLIGAASALMIAGVLAVA